MSDNDARVEQLKQEIDRLSEELEHEVHAQQGYPDNEEDYDQGDNEDYKLNALSVELDKKQQELRKLEFDSEYAQRQEEFKDIPHSSGFIISDIESGNDLLSRRQYASSIGRLITGRETSPPLSIGVYGQWGEGKSSFLRLIEEELKTLNQERQKDADLQRQYTKTHIVRFDATEYDDQSKIWFSILKQLFKKFEEERGFWAKVIYGSRKFILSFRKNKAKYLINLFIAGALIAWFYVLNKENSILSMIQKNKAYVNAIGAIASLAAVVNIVIPFIQKLNFLTKPLSERVTKHVLIPNYTRKLGTREDVKDDLKNLIDIWITDKKEEKIVVFVDELDRCTEKTIVEFFNALQLLLPIESIMFVISINKEAVSYALANNNKHYFEGTTVTKEQKLAFGHQYLEKYITIPFYLPVERSYEEYIHSLTGDEKGVFTHEERDLIYQTLKKVTRTLHVTPREMKRIINILILSKETVVFVNESRKYKAILKFEEYIRWFLFEYFNPHSAKFILDQISKHYRSNKFKNFRYVRFLFMDRDINEKIQGTEHAQELFDLLDDIRLEYIVYSSLISDSFNA